MRTTVNTGGITTLGALGLLLVVFKISGYITWSWWLVLLPFYISAALVFLLFIGFLSSYLLMRLVEGPKLKVPRPSWRARISSKLASWFRRAANRLDALDDDRFLHQQIARAFNLPPHCRSFAIRWEVGHAVMITTECFVSKSGYGSTIELDKLTKVLTQQSRLVEVGRFERGIGSTNHPDLRSEL